MCSKGRCGSFCRTPRQNVRLSLGETFVAVAGRPHLVTNVGEGVADFPDHEGIGEYDDVPLV